MQEHTFKYQVTSPNTSIYNEVDSITKLRLTWNISGMKVSKMEKIDVKLL